MQHLQQHLSNLTHCSAAKTKSSPRSSSLNWNKVWRKSAMHKTWSSHTLLEFSFFFIWNPARGRWKKDERGSGVRVMVVTQTQVWTLPLISPRFKPSPFTCPSGPSCGQTRRFCVRSQGKPQNHLTRVCVCVRLNSQRLASVFTFLNAPHTEIDMLSGWTASDQIIQSWSWSSNCFILISYCFYGNSSFEGTSAPDNNSTLAFF